MPRPPLLEAVAGSAPARWLAGHAARAYARHRVRALARPAGPAQERALLRLVGHAAGTRFGRDHDFAGIRTVRDYQTRVPLRTYEQFWDDYWKGPFPHTAGATWPDFIPYFGLSSGTTSGATKYIPLSRQILASNTRAALTTLALFLDAHPDTQLANGRLFFLGGSTDLVDLAGGRGPRVLGGDLSGITALEAQAVLRPYSFPPVELALMKDWDRKMDELARQAAALPITMISGVPSWLLVLFDRLRRVTGKTTLAEIWPTLRLVIHGGTKFEPYRELFRRQFGSDAIRTTEVYPASEAYIAAEDPRRGLLRLIPDHGVFFEFVPVEELDAARPTRHMAADLEPGVNYAVVLSTCAGLWSYVLGDTVTFESRDPPLLRFTGRTKYFLSAFGEHLISEEVERAVAAAARAAGTAVVDFHVGPVFPADPAKPGRHRYLVEFSPPEFTERRPEGPGLTQPDQDGLARFAAELDAELCRVNEDYQAHRQGDLTMLAPEVVVMPPGGFTAWMRARGKLGGQHKVPRMDNTGELTREISRFIGEALM